MAFRKIKAGLVNADIDQFIGEIGNLFFDIETGVLRLSDGRSAAGTPVYTFINLPDTPISYAGFAGKFLAVSATEDALEFVDAASGSSFTLVGSVDTSADLPTPYDGNNGDALISIDDTHLYIWTGSQWVDIGAAQTPISGFTGSRGDVGFTGSQGDVGATGSIGDRGYTGSIGYTGSQGDAGYTGSTGETGYTGSQGNIGYTGSQGDTGFIGSQGDQGYTGSIGYTGSQGDIGFTGSQGDVGYIGSQGDQGYTGSIGFTGSQGNFGYTGSQGDIGNIGSQGDIGYTGSQGDIGYTGSLGYTGSIGYTGSQGDIGYTGSQGDIGYTGSLGYTGSIGYTGSQGEKGADGSGLNIVGAVNSENELPANYSGAVGDGYIVKDTGNLWVWDGLQWNNVGQIVGFTGSAGNVGFTGSQGDIGFTGSAGVDGVIGRDGFTGSQGDIGFTGSAGVDGVIGRDGYTGSAGDIGFTGSQGDIGFTGSAGDIGYTGSQGDIGFTGSQGDIGFTGSAGNVGFTGSSGDIGYTGSIGFTGSAVPGMVSNGIDTITIEPGYNIVPATDGLQSLGSPTAAWGEIYVSGNSIYLGGNIISINADGSLDITDSAGNPISVRAKNFFVGRVGMPANTQGIDVDGIMFPDGSLQITAAPRMYTNADAENGLSLSDLKPGDYYYDDINAAIYICYDTGLGYFDILDLTVRA
jgi:hypothetical protein